MKLTTFLDGLGWWAPLLVLVVLVTGSLAIKWVADWSRARRRMRRIHGDLSVLLSSWRTEALAVAVRTTKEMGYDALLRYSRSTTVDLLERVLPGLLPSFPETRWTRHHLDLVAEVSPLVGLSGTVMGFWLALSNLANASAAPAGFSALAGPAGLALKSTLLCLACSIVALLVMGLFSLDSSEQRVRDACAALHREIQDRLADRRRMGAES